MQIVLSLKNVRHVVQVHSSYSQSGGRLRSRHIENSLKLWLRRAFVFRRAISLVRQFDRIVTLTQGDACHWNSSRVVVIPNPLMIDTPVGFVQREKKVIAVGSLLLVRGGGALPQAADAVIEPRANIATDDRHSQQVYVGRDICDDLAL